METKTIIAYDRGYGEWPWRVLVDGKKDPRNRDFESFEDVKRTYRVLQAAGFYHGYTVVTE